MCVVHRHSSSRVWLNKGGLASRQCSHPSKPGVTRDIFRDLQKASRLLHLLPWIHSMLNRHVSWTFFFAIRQRLHQLESTRAVSNIIWGGKPTNTSGCSLTPTSPSHTVGKVDPEKLQTWGSHHYLFCPPSSIATEHEIQAHETAVHTQKAYGCESHGHPDLSQAYTRRLFTC